MKWEPVIIVGAPRSGTNMLRDVLTSLDGIGTWPCDEINYIWRHGNVRVETDEFGAEMATEGVSNYIRNAFDTLAEKQNLDVVVEKTCANSLRVPFVDRVIPTARYIFIYRDGVDVVGSSLKRWKAELDFPYLMRKARYVPALDLPYYACRYFGNRIFRLFSKEDRLAFWGPKFNGLNEALGAYSLEEVCALQWKRCIDLSEEAFANMPPGKVVRVKYESFVSRPGHELKRILGELKLSFDEDAINRAVANVSDRSVGKGREALNKAKLNKINALLVDSLAKHGYP